MRTRDEIAYYVAVGTNGIGYETRCDNLEDARELYRFRTRTEIEEVELYKYNFTKGTRTTINHRKARY